ncbi:MAG: hypothetical protein R3E77_03600 [Steroidobacteraceae bacterium]
MNLFATYGKTLGFVLAVAVLLPMAGCLSSAPTGAPEITQQPEDLAGFETQTVVFRVGAKGGVPLTFQWQRDGVDISGATLSTYTTGVLTAADTGARFRVVVTNPKGTATSDEATLTVNPPPTITAEPAAQAVDAGATATFSVTASGESITYQWLRDGVGISGATSATYTTDATVAADDAVEFRVVVSNPAGNVISNAAVLTVRGPAAVTGEPASQTVATGEPAIFAVVATGGELTYQWQRNGADIAGATAPTYLLGAAAASDDGAQFRAIVTNVRGVATSAAATLNVVSRPIDPLPARSVEVVASKTATNASAFAVALIADGSLKAWGANQDGQFGDGSASLTPTETPVTVAMPAGSVVTAVSAGNAHVLALLDDGRVFSWGRNTSGQLGNGTAVTTPTPGEVTLPAAAVAIAAGGDFSLAVLADGRIYSWGTNGIGQLGVADRTIVGSVTPVQVSGVANALAVAAGSLHAVALLADGSVVTWGANTSGQLGTGNLRQARTPVATGLTGIVAVRANATSSMAISSRRTLYAWGENSDGQLGRDGSPANDVAAPAGILPDVVDAAATDKIMLAVRSDGTVAGAGSNEAGSLGDGTTTARATFATALVMTDARTISAGGSSFALAVQGDGSVYAWGDNTGEQLANGSLTAAGTSTPTLVPGLDLIP